MKSPISLLLDFEQSEILADAGPECFAVVGRCTYPGKPDRWEILLAPCDINTANLATGVIRGTHRAVKIKPTTTSKP